MKNLSLTAGPLFAVLFGGPQSAKTTEKYRRALADEQERQAKKPASDERKEGEAKWIN
jgi:hypothetical protein